MLTHQHPVPVLSLLHTTNSTVLILVCSQYFSYNGILILVGISVLVQLSHSLKVLLTLGVVLAYCIINLTTKHQMYDNYDMYVHFNHE